jgi:predicted nucleotidyltransferase
MRKYNDLFLSLVDDFSKHESVEAVLLSGSRTDGHFDGHSDYDLYIYCSAEIPLDFRKEIADTYFSYAELNHTTWEREDQGFFKEIDIPIDIVYRDRQWLEGVLENIVIKCQASTGYSTCLWANLMNSDILYDKDGKLRRLQKKYDVDYPEELRKNIIKKNFPLLDTIIPAYTRQIDKALKRADIISINHRTAAFFESYFDIIFAVNKKLHPGEKKLLKIASEQLALLPENMQADISELFRNLFNEEYDIVNQLHGITKNLEVLLKELRLI